MNDFREWEELTEKEQLESVYSDTFKDVNGFRPRGFEMTVSELKVALEALREDAEIQLQHDIARQQKAIIDIEKTITTIQENCSCDRADALRYLKDAEGEDWYSWGYFSYEAGLPHHYFKEVA